MRNPRNERLSSDIDSASPERTCILSGGTAARDELLRLAISPDGLVLPDVHARAPGRGAWIGVSREALEKAVAKGKLKGALARAFKGAPLSVPDDLADRIEQALIRALTERLGLELKSGKLLMGSDRIAQNAREGRVEWLGHSADASQDGSRKLDQAWRVGSEAEGSGLQGTRLPLDRETLSVALGRDNVVHLALTDRGAANRVASLLQRLLHFQGQAASEGHAVGMDEDNGQAGAAPVTTN
ncbi:MULTISPECIES: DUF448 domain-containing protein [unclassified Novosphingobium]|uniref:DUF448 domain-containing protein n=1 Tax=unclassified Novosphingobium TaxID=2644732 RepID=UPI00020EEB0F|nr:MULTISPECIES: DUF448 domain-containing protein [unclassified Novosphingobium]GFM27543.1 transcription terminating nucleic-acid-binding protein [Novosphingobium sp. PY1]CCA92047.1 conserved hypothetical protein [Novosphingobium sp. PP1Y]